MKRAIAFGLLLFFSLGFARVASAQRPDEGTMKLGLAYSGVSIAGGDPPGLKPPPAGFQYITWPGFRTSESGSEVFLQLTGATTFERKDKKLKIFVTLDKVKVHLRNSLRPIITKSFSRTPVDSFRVRDLGEGRMRLEISLRRKATPEVSMKTLDKYTYLVVAFPPVRKKR
jgi:hypothetical protein